ncbi:MAG TPA: cyclic nucleotide-binding domain-containing protein [Verrucomicrobiae bacterium]|nr:cyclic nucleotide-binding domain-containing protein [Verrucomicrobiae bacterium]
MDGVVYGPVDLPTLSNWIKEERVASGTWVYGEQKDAWHRAGDIAELRDIFEERPAGATAAVTLSPAHPSTAGIDAKTLRRMRIFMNLNLDQVRRFMDYMDVFPVNAWSLVVKQGDPGDAMYVVIDGELRARLMISGKETLLATLSPGDFFGEISLFDHGPRSADVVANRDSLLLKISVANFKRLSAEAPDLAAPFLLSVCKTLTARIRQDNKRLRESIRAFRSMTQFSNV